jgi:hypothetical protein
MPKGRTRIHNDYPAKITCTVCKKDIKQLRNQFLKHLEKSGLNNDDYITAYKCSSCLPPEERLFKRGRVRKHNDFPSKLVCGNCSCKTIQGREQFFKALKKSGLSQEEYITTYRCRSCRPKKPKKIPEKKIREATQKKVFQKQSKAGTHIIKNEEVSSPVYSRIKPFLGVTKRIADTSQDNLCWNQVFYLSHNKYCDGCYRFNYCGFDGKRLSSDKKSQKTKAQNVQSI